MEKTIEEKKAAVLAECERLCHAEGITADFGWMRVVALPQIRVPRWKILIGAHPLVTVSAEMDEDVTELAYRLFGLETRDAVAETKSHFTKSDAEMIEAYPKAEVGRLKAESELAKWKSRAWKILSIVRKREAEQRPKTANVLKALRECGENLEAERAKTAKLVEEIGYISETNRKHNWPYNDPHQIAEDINQMMNALENALEAHNKGGENEH